MATVYTNYVFEGLLAPCIASMVSFSFHMHLCRAAVHAYELNSFVFVIDCMALSASNDTASSHIHSRSNEWLKAEPSYLKVQYVTLPC